MKTKPLDWIIRIGLVTVFVFTTIRTEYKINQFTEQKEQIVLPEILPAVKDTILDESIKTVVETRPEIEVEPTGVTEEICTPKTCPPPITYSRKTIFSRWRRR